MIINVIFCLIAILMIAFSVFASYMFTRFKKFRERNSFELPELREKICLVSDDVNSLRNQIKVYENQDFKTLFYARCRNLGYSKSILKDMFGKDFIDAFCSDYTFHLSNNHGK